MTYKYIDIRCPCDEWPRVSIESVPHIEEMQDTIEDWETIGAEQRTEIDRLRSEVAGLRYRLANLTRS